LQQIELANLWNITGPQIDFEYSGVKEHRIWVVKQLPILEEIYFGKNAYYALKEQFPEAINKTIKEILFTLIYVHDKEYYHSKLELFDHLMLSWI